MNARDPRVGQRHATTLRGADRSPGETLAALRHFAAGRTWIECRVSGWAT